MTRTVYTAQPVLDGDDLSDLRVLTAGKTWHLWGRTGRERELALADSVPDGVLPVLIGSGLGLCLDALLKRDTPVAVVDRETPLLALSKAAENRTSDNLLWVDDPDPHQGLDRLSDWQAKNKNHPLFPIVLPLYLRLDREYYGGLVETLKAANTIDFWSQARYPKFRSINPRVLFFDSDYFLCREIRAALDRLSVEYRSIPLLDREMGSSDFIESLLKAVIDFKPDFVLTVNHFGLDREGKLAGLLDDLGLPLASWFVDNPHLILFDYAHPGVNNTAIFTFDAGNLDEMRTRGFTHVHYLPLATDPDRFQPGLGASAPAQWASNLSFVGNSMTKPVAKCLGLSRLPVGLAQNYESVARDYGRSGETSVARFLEASHPDWAKALHSMPTSEQRLAVESLITWEATRQYRLACVTATVPFSPLIVGDDNWTDLLPAASGVRFLPPLDYYEDLPRFYPMSDVNFNCTSRQMKGAVNQRVFDVPACGGFLLTDHREQMEALFDLDTEAVVYRHVEEIPFLTEKFLSDPKLRTAISRAAAKRILAEHTYVNRLDSLLAIMRDTFA